MSAGTQRQHEERREEPQRRRRRAEGVSLPLSEAMLEANHDSASQLGTVARVEPLTQ
jgi:hypothetical protein